MRGAARVPLAAKQGCYEPLVLSLLSTAGVEGAMGLVDRLAELDTDVKRDGHVYAHAIGISAYQTPERAGEVFGRCTPAFQSGCYHGVIQAYFADVGAGGASLAEDAVVALCADQRNDPAEHWLLFQCVHGMGHGLMMTYAHDLPRALEGCDLLPGPWEQDGCYGGAFMENIVNATMPHHPAAALAEHGGEESGAAVEHGAGGHEHHAGTESQPPFRALDPAEPHYPCSVLGARYQQACYMMQTSAVLFANEQDFPATIEFCETAPEAVRSTCFVSLGRDISAYTLQDHRKAVDLCSLAAPADQPWCHVGVVKNFVDLTADPADGLAYCRDVPAGEGREACYRAVGEQIANLQNEVEERRAWCRRAEEEYVGMCLRGAGVGDQ